MKCHYKQENLDEIIKGMKALGEVLIPFNYPKVPFDSNEDEIGIFKMRNVTIDGYSLLLHYNKSDYDGYFIESLQIHSNGCPFLPFNLICKIGKRFLGSKCLSLIEIFKDHKKIYVWSVCTDKYNNPVEIPNKDTVEECEYEGLHYCYLQSNEVDFF